MSKEDFDKRYVAELDYTYGHPLHARGDRGVIEWWRVVINRIHEMIQKGELRPPYKQKFE